MFDLREIQYPSGDGSDVLDVLTADQLRINVDAAFRWRVDPTRVRDLYVQVGEPFQVEALVYNTFRSGVRDAVAEVTATNILSEQRAGLAPRIRALMEDQLTPRGIVMTDFFLRGIDPPQAIRIAVEEKLSREQQVAAEQYQTAVVKEQANQRRAEAEGEVRGRDQHELTQFHVLPPSSSRGSARARSPRSVQTLPLWFLRWPSLSPACP